MVGGVEFWFVGFCEVVFCVVLWGGEWCGGVLGFSGVGGWVWLGLIVWMGGVFFVFGF